MSKAYEQREWEFSGTKIPVKIYRERRRSIRYYLGKNGGIIRLPIFLGKEQENIYFEQFKNWLEKQVNKRPKTANGHQPKIYQDGDSIQVGTKSYALSITKEDRRTHSGRLKNGRIELKLSRSATSESLQKDIPTLLSRLIAKDFLPRISRRVDELNDRFFQQDIEQIRLKHTHTVWGSCSRKRNLNLSTRLLFAPQEVIDYVIIHELAHLIEMNHSSRFWRLVEQAMPNYKEKEKWLKENGHLCHF
jgi:predicted metal-dependent hydrolase